MFAFEVRASLHLFLYCYEETHDSVAEHFQKQDKLALMGT